MSLVAGRAFTHHWTPSINDVYSGRETLKSKGREQMNAWAAITEPEMSGARVSGAGLPAVEGSDWTRGKRGGFKRKCNIPDREKRSKNNR